MAVTSEPDRDRPVQQMHPGNPLRVLFVASEIYPLAKTGGLADVCASLPPQLARRGIDIRLLMPGYTGAMEQIFAPQVVADLGEVLPGAPVRLVAGWTPDSGLPIWLIDCPSLFQRPGTMYQDPDGRDWEDNALRFGVLSHVAARLGLGRAGLGWRPDIVHAHDWHTGLVPLLLAQETSTQRPRTVFTIHNAAFQGCFPIDSAGTLNLPAESLGAGGIEFYGRVSFLKAGVLYADKVTTVSPTYAREIQTPEYGCGLEGVYRDRARDLTGIMNGIDSALWDPASDPCLPRTYSRENLEGKRVCKASLQHHAGLFIDSRAPLVAFVSRLTQQKMADAVLEQLPHLLEEDTRLQFVVHGRGEHDLETGFRQLAGKYPGRLAVNIGYEESYAHRLHAGADILLHGSRFEPCGLTQLYAMRYGTIPVVSRVGGLLDSVVDATMCDATGFVFNEANGNSMCEALRRCLDHYHARPDQWGRIQARGMSVDFSWGRSAGKYLDLYAGLVPDAILQQAPGQVAPEVVSEKHDGTYGKRAISPRGRNKPLVSVSSFG